jgi:hypothetical protein
MNKRLPASIGYTLNAVLTSWYYLFSFAPMTLCIAGIAVTNSSRHFNFKLRPATKRKDGIDLLEGGYLWDQKRSAKGSSTASVMWITARDRFPKGLSKTCQ